MTGVSGWYEGECGAIQFHYDNVIGVNGLANLLLTEFGQDCIGVDIEISGEYLDGTNTEDSLKQLFDILDSPEWPDFVEGDLV
jgi:hypothetical protein